MNLHNNFLHTVYKRFTNLQDEIYKIIFQNNNVIIRIALRETINNTVNNEK